MRTTLLLVASIAASVVCWGSYGPTLHVGQDAMALEGGVARLRPFVCVGLAYFLIGVLVPSFWLYLRGEKGEWTFSGMCWSLLAGTFGALGALGVVLAFAFGGHPVYVMPLIFGGAPVVNAFLTIYMARRMKEIGPFFLAGLIMVILGAVTVLIFNPANRSGALDGGVLDWIRRLLSIGLTIVCWGSYGPTLHKGQTAMHHSRMRPLLCVGIAYFVIAVLLGNLLLIPLPELSSYTFAGTTWSLVAGAAGALGALGIIMSFYFGGRPVFVMPLVFGGAPVVNTIETMIARDQLGEVGAMFLAGLILVIAGSVIVLVLAPRGEGPKQGESTNREAPRPLRESETPRGAPLHQSPAESSPTPAKPTRQDGSDI